MQYDKINDADMDKESRKCLVRWHDYSSSVTVAVQTLKYDEELLDITLACEGQTIRAHKLVLAASSQYFRKVLKEFPCEHPTIVVDNMKYEELLSILHFMYYGQVLVEEDQMSSLLASAASLAVIGLSYVTEALSDDKVRNGILSNLDSGCSSELGLTIKKTNEQETNTAVEDQSVPSKSFLDIKQKDIKPEENTNACSTIEPLKPETSASFEAPGTHNPKDNLLQIMEEPSEIDQPPNKRHKLLPCDKIKSDYSTLQSSSALRECTSPVTISPVENGISTKDNENSLINEHKSSIKQLLEQSSKLEPSELPVFKASEIINNGHRSSPPLSKDLEVSAPLTNGNEFHSTNNNFLNDSHKMEMDNGDASFLENGDSDTGPAALPFNHPAVLAASSTAAIASAAAALAAAANGGNNSTLSSITAVNYAALLAANAKGLLPNSNVRNYLLNQGGNSLLPQWTPPADHSPSSSPPVGPSSPHSPGYIHPTAMSQQDLQATLDQYQRKLAFHEPRPCPTCKRMYRDAATLRTHITIMHAEAGNQPFSCTCGALFSTKYDMYQHRKNGHR